MKKTEVVFAVIKKENKFLLGKRSSEKVHDPSSWSLVGGRVELGEKQDGAISRECLEEIGVVVKPMSLLKSFGSLRQQATYNYWLVEVVSGEPKICNDEHTEIGWFNLEEIKALSPLVSNLINLLSLAVD